MVTTRNGDDGLARRFMAAKFGNRTGTAHVRLLASRSFSVAYGKTPGIQAALPDTGRYRKPAIQQKSEKVSPGGVEPPTFGFGSGRRESKISTETIEVL